MTTHGPQACLHYLAALQIASRARLEALVLCRMGRVQKELQARLERTGESASEQLVFVGPFEHAGIQVNVCSISHARTFAFLAGMAVDPPPAGEVLVFAWDSQGATSLRTFPLELPTAATKGL